MAESDACGTVAEAVVEKDMSLGMEEGEVEPGCAPAERPPTPSTEAEEWQPVEPEAPPSGAETPPTAAEICSGSLASCGLPDLVIPQEADQADEDAVDFVDEDAAELAADAAKQPQVPGEPASHNSQPARPWGLRGALSSLFGRGPAAEPVRPADEPSTHRALLLAEVGPPAPRPARAAEERKVIVFGLAVDGGRAENNPVVVKSIPVEGEDVQTRVELREIGVRLAGSYRLLEAEEGEEPGVRLVEWLPPGQVEERAKPLEVLLDGATHVRMYPPSRASDPDEVIEVSLTSAHDFRAPSLRYHVVPSTSRDCASAQGGFRRCLVQVGWNGVLDVPPALLGAAGAGPRGFAETGEVLAQTLALRLGPGQGMGVEELEGHLQQAPRLLYFASAGLLTAVLGPQAREALRAHWDRELQLSIVGKFPMSVEQREARLLLRELLLARHPESGDRTCAVVPRGHLPEIYEMMRRTKHPHVALSIERWNFESRAREIEAKLADSTVTFVIVTVTGSMSPLQLASLVQLGRGCLRLVFVDYPSLQRSLALTRSEDRVLLPPSLAGLRERQRPTDYRRASPVGAAVAGAAQALLADPSALSRDSGGLPWDRNWRWLEAELQRAGNWRAETDAWRASGRTLLHLVTPDDEPVLAHFSGGSARLFDADEGSEAGLLPFSQLDALVERVKQDTGRESREKGAEPGPVFVLLNHHFVPQSKLEDLVSRCHTSGARLVLVARELPVALRRVRVQLPGRCATHVQADVLLVRTSAEDLLQQSAAQPSESSPRSRRLLEALRLVFGPEKLTCRQARAILGATGEDPESPAWCDVAAGLAGGSGASAEQLAAAQDVLRAALGLKAQRRASLAFVVASAAAAGSAAGADVAFGEFVRMPLCRFLSQTDRLEAWLRYLSPDADPQHHKVSSYTLRDNCHGGDLLELFASEGEERSGRAVALPVPAYIGTGPTDSTVSKWEVYTQCTLQGRDLDWEALVEQWGARKSLDARDVAALMEVSLDALKLALCIPPSSLLRLQEAISTSGGPAPAALRRLREHFLAASAVGGLARAAAAGAVAEAERCEPEALLDRLAAIKYVLLTLEADLDESSADDSEELLQDLSADDLARLLRHHLKLSPGPRSASWVCRLLAMDEPRDLLVEQTEVRRFILQTTDGSPTVDLGTAPVGAAFMTLLTTPHIRQRLCQDGHCPVVRVPLFASLLAWLNGGEAASEDALAEGAERLSAKAFSTLLVHGPTTSALQRLVRCSVWPGCGREPLKRAELLNALAREKGAEHLVVPVLEALVEQERASSVSQEESAAFRGALEVTSCGALYDMLRLHDLTPYLALQDAPPLPLDTSPNLLEMYVEHFRSREPDLADAEHFRRLNESSCTAVVTRLLADRGAPRLLLWHCWARDPSLVLPSVQFPQGQEDWPTFLCALTSANFRTHAVGLGYGLSAAARMIVKPHTLPLAVFNLFAPLLSWIHRAPPSCIEERLLLVAQEGNSDYPPYCLRWHFRPLLRPLKEKLLEGLRGTVEPVAGEAELQNLYPRITEGVSSETFAHNLSLLFPLAQQPKHGRDTFVGFHKAMLAACVLVWFRAQDVSKEELRACIAAGQQAAFDAAWDQLQQMQNDEMRSKCAAGPLPTYIDVQWLEPGNVVRGQLFAVSKPSAQLTAQWLNNLCVHAGLDLEPFQASDLVEVFGARDRDVRPGRRYEGALEAVARSWGVRVARRLFSDRLAVRASGGSELDTSGLTGHFSLLADFCQLLMEQRERLEAFFCHLVEGLTEGLAEPEAKTDANDGSAAVYDVLFLLFGVTPENHGLEMRLVTAEFGKQGLKGSKEAMSEMEWLHRNFYRAEDGTRRNLGELLNCRIGVHPIKRHFDNAVPITRYSAPCQRPDADQILQAPRYLEPQHFALCLDGEESSLLPEGTAAADLPALADKVGAAASQGTEASRGSCFFTASKEASHSGLAMGKRERAKLTQGGRATISAGDLLKVETSPTFYMYACLKVAPGLQPLLQQDAPDRPVYRLTASETARERKKAATAAGGLSRIFASNADAWRYVDGLGPRTTLMANGFYLTKADDGSWVPILASNRSAGGGARRGIIWSGEGGAKAVDQKLCLWPFVHSADLVSLDLDPSVRHLLELVVVLAFRLAEGCTAEELQVLPAELEKDMLTHLSAALDKISRTSVAVEAGSSAELGAWLAAYQRQERGICACLREALREVARHSATGDLVGVLAAACRRLGGDGMPFVQEGPNGSTEPAELGIYLAQHLAVVWCKLDPAPRRQLRAALARATAGPGSLDPSSPAGSVKKVVKHHRVTLRSFEGQGLDLLARLAQAPSGAEVWRYDEGFTDSEDDSDSGEHGGCFDDLVVVQPPTRTNGADALGKFVKVEREAPYVDSELDRSGGAGARLFGRPAGFGRPVRSKYVVMTFYDADCPHYFVGLDAERLKIQYSMEDGLPLGYLLHKRLIAGLLESAMRSEGGVEVTLSLRDRLLAWIANVLRSPISDGLKAWILRKVELQGRNAQTPPVSNINSLIIAYSLCSCCPNTTPEAQFLRHVLTQSLTSAVEGVTPTVERFIRRKEQYGIYIVKGGTIFELQSLFGHENVTVCDYEHEVSQRTVSINWMYLDIIKRFHGFTSIVYVQGLRTIEDALLKWLAEYTRHHSWRYVFFENVDTCWNFSENRDRCNFSFAPESLTTDICYTSDLLSSKVASVRPSHVVDYRCCPPPELCRDPSALLAFFRRELPCEFLEKLPESSMVGDFRGELRGLLGRQDPCVVLVVSPPGAGKTFFMDDLRARLESAERAVIVQFDGSSDILVTHTISELLDRAVAVQGERVLLVLDEYHMLVEAQKAQLFEWIEEKAAGLQVVLIANRIDSKDRERVQACTLDARLIETRLSRTVLDEKLSYSGVAKASWQKVRLWYGASRLVFGEESISLRLVEPIAAALQQPDPQQGLREILLSKVPTISPIAADHFVAAFLARTGGGTFAGGPFAALFGVAALDEAYDSACSYHEFASRMPRGLLNAAPPVRLLCWSAYVLALRAGEGQVGSSEVASRHVSLSSLLEYEYVDQVGTPFQLCEPPSGRPARGRAFSWAGDYESLDGIIDATKRGHSVDWQDLREKRWQHTTVTESEKVCQLLSCCRNPAACLEALTPDNIVLLLQSASPEDSVVIARHVLLNNVHSGSSESLYQQALWALVLNDCAVTSPWQLAEITDGAAGPPELEALDAARARGGPALVPRLLTCLEWAQEHAGDRRQVKCKLDAREREELLQRALVLATLCGGGSPERQGQLWSGVFAQLLVAPTEESEAGWGADSQSQSIETALPIQSLRSWLQCREAFEREWPVEVRNLWSVMHCKAPASVVNSLWRRSRVLLCEPSALGRLSPCVLAGVVRHEGGELDKDLQRGILTSGCIVPEEVNDDDLLRVTSAAMRLIGQAELPSGSDPRLVRLVAQEASRRGSA